MFQSITNCRGQSAGVCDGDRTDRVPRSSNYKEVITVIEAIMTELTCWYPNHDQVMVHIFICKGPFRTTGSEDHHHIGISYIHQIAVCFPLSPSSESRYSVAM